jgi:MFS superfamily sulfate permease-like transporter
MEITMFDVWLFTRLDTIKHVSCFLSGFMFVTAIFWGCAYIFEERMVGWCKKHKLFIRGYIVVFLVTTVLAVLMPSTKEAAAIYLIPKIVNNEDVQELPGKLGQLVHGKLDEWLDDLTKDKK